MSRVYLIVSMLGMVGLSYFSVYKFGYMNGRRDIQIVELRQANKNMSEILREVEKFETLQKQMEAYRVEIKQELESKKEVVKQEVIKYEKDPAHTSIHFDDEWVRIYNYSLPARTESETSSGADDLHKSPSKDEE
ncbi:i-spanin [Aeromonas phage BUCT695]|uniref:i-spanin n=1 Tax=Aeromonas phage BUCT695 TaxID=2908630 RepID=UPI00232946B1|nr:i-spanin [Aeromonas phage BUCT695]UIW10582.1 i-spanin [Aeromonas phage BUCT695]